MDIWLNPDNQNKLKFLNFLNAEGFDQESLDHISNTDFTKHAAFHIGEKPLQVDFLTIISGVKFSEAEPKTIIAFWRHQHTGFALRPSYFI